MMEGNVGAVIQSTANSSSLRSAWCVRALTEVRGGHLGEAGSLIWVLETE